METPNALLVTVESLPVASTEPAWKSNTSFSEIIPMLQIAWDSTSLGALKTCPRFYQLSVVEGWQPKNISVHLTFGLHYHAALERYDHARADGKTHAEATIAATRYALECTWDSKLKRPWLSDDPNKNRFTLVRSVVWYLDQFAEDPLETVILANGKPAVELSFRFQTSFTSGTNETFMYCGHMDRMANFNGATYIVDRKTSKSQINQDFFDKFSPDNQFSGYTFSAEIVYSTPVAGLIVDGAQIAVTFTRYQRGLVQRTKAQLEEWYRDMGILLAQAEIYARAVYWPMNDKSCNNYGGCQFRKICGKSPSVRDQWLAVDFSRRVWDPLQSRGDI